MQSLKRSNLVGFIAIAAVVVLAFFVSTQDTKAAAPDFNRVFTATATTSVTYITPGNATTTMVYDSMFTGSDSAVLLTQLTASSTSTVLNIGVEYAMDTTGVDCQSTPTACDWYADNLLGSLNSTTTAVKSIQLANSYSWLAASTARAGKAIEIPTPTRYTRVTYSMTGASGAIWGALVAKKQQPE